MNADAAHRVFTAEEGFCFVYAFLDSRDCHADATSFLSVRLNISRAGARVNTGFRGSNGTGTENVTPQTRKTSPARKHILYRRYGQEIEPDPPGQACRITFWISSSAPPRPRCNTSCYPADGITADDTAWVRVPSSRRRIRPMRTKGLRLSLGRFAECFHVLRPSSCRSPIRGNPEKVAKCDFQSSLKRRASGKS